MERAVFIDRDGVIIENRTNYVRSWNDVIFIPAALTALRSAFYCSYKIILVTNQSAVGRGLITIEKAEEINQRIKTVVTESGGRLDAIFMCPHAPQERCTCRKPLPGLLFQAAEKFNLDLSHSYMIGDALSDLQAGRAANVRETMLVRTGRGQLQAVRPEALLMEPFLVFDTLLEAFGHIFAQSDC